MPEARQAGPVLALSDAKIPCLEEAAPLYGIYFQQLLTLVALGNPG